MPEGDSIRRVAAELGPHLVGSTIRELVLRHRGPIDVVVGARVEAIDVVGKHMFILIEGGWGLHVHLGMRGRWQRYAPGEPWRWNKRGASIALVTDTAEVGCFRASKAELLRGVALLRHPARTALGPDLLADAVDYRTVLRRARAGIRRDLGIAELLLDQRVAAGIGNVYKSEVLFVEKVHPRTRVRDLDDATIERLYRTARDLLARNLGPGARETTVQGNRRLADRRQMPRHYVYGRHHQPCVDCRTPVEVERTGDHARTTYWCPTCQPATLPT